MKRHFGGRALYVSSESDVGTAQLNSSVSFHQATGGFMKAFIALLIAFPLSAVAGDGPFGLSAGMTLEELKELAPLKKSEDFVYVTTSVPQNHNAFEEYRLVITPQHGLCKVVAWTGAISTSSYGDAVQAQFSALFNAVASKYGSGKKYDFLRSGSIWDEPRDWMMGLVKEERYLTAFWTNEESQLPASIRVIKLEAHGISSTKALIELGYEFSNNPSCADWIRSQQNSAL